MFPLRLANLSPDEFILEYTEYLFRTKMEKRVYLDENFVEYVGSYVYNILQEAAAMMAEMTSFACNQAIIPVVTFASDSIFHLISVSTDFLADFSKIQMVCIMVLACLVLGLNKSIRTTRKIKKELKIYESMMKHAQFQFDMARPDMEDITSRLTNSEVRMSSTMSELQHTYELLDMKYLIEHRLSTDSEFWTPLIMAEVVKLDRYNKIWQEGTDLERVNEIRDLGRRVDVEVAKIRSKIDALKESIIERKNHPNLCFDELAYCNPDGSPIELFTAAGDFSCNIEFEATDDGVLSLGLTSTNSDDGYNCTEIVKASDVELELDLTSADSAKELEDSKAKKDEAFEVDELISGPTADSNKRLSWAERTETYYSEELDFSLILKWADEEETGEENDALDSRLGEKVYTTEAREFKADKTNTESSCLENNDETELNNGQGDNEVAKLSWAEQVDLAEQIETEMGKEGAFEEGFNAYSPNISWADQVEAVYPLEEMHHQISSLSWAEQVEEAERLGQL